jgi:epoxide hydrolase-like predicted phosphatase
MKIEALIFDIGNVVIPFDWVAAEGRLRIRSGSGKTSMREEIRGLMNQFEVGEIPQKVFVPMAARAIGFQGDEQEFIAIFNSIFYPNPPMERSIQQLAARFPLYLLSNTSELHLAYLQRKFKVLQHFADGVYSFNAKCAKPDRKIFQIAAKQFGVTPESTVYIDDLEANVRSALELGFHAIRYEWREHVEFERRLAEFGIQVGACQV